jgi:hypothetical protein
MTEPEGLEAINYNESEFRKHH